MKIALLTDSFTVGGGLEYLHQIAVGLPDHSFVICGSGGIAVDRFRLLPNVTLEAGGYGPAIVRCHAPDLIHFNHLRPLAAHCLRPGAISAPSINTVHGIHLRRYDFLSGIHNRILASCRLQLERYCLGKIDLNIVLTETDRDYLVQRLGARHVVVIPNGVPAAHPLPVPASGADGYVHFLTPARFDFQKGHDVLLRAIDSIQARLRHANCRFDLVGDGPLRPAMEQMAQTLGIADLVCFHGLRTDVPRFLSATNCMVLPSRWEGLPLVMLEAGQYARDVICSDACGNRDVAAGGRCAVLFRNEDPADLAAKLLAYLTGTGIGLGPALQARVVEKYTIERMLSELEEAYQRVAAEARGRHSR